MAEIRRFPFLRHFRAEPSFHVVDLNRARLSPSLSLWRRSRDLSRLPIVWPKLRGAFAPGESAIAHAAGRFRARSGSNQIAPFTAGPSPVKIPAACLIMPVKR